MAAIPAPAPALTPAAARQARNTFWNNLNDSERAKTRHDLWMRRSGQWNGGRFGIDWVPHQILGMGGFGICGSFRYTGNVAGMPAMIVVKQATGASKQELMRESFYLQALRRNPSPHIVQIYKSYCTDRSTGTHGRFDPPPPAQVPNAVPKRIPMQVIKPTANRPVTVNFSSWNPAAFPTVSRIYMECCDLKSLDIHAWTEWGRNVGAPAGAAAPPVIFPPEDVVWGAWECLARALFVLENGSETHFIRHWSPIMHFDLKGGNNKHNPHIQYYRAVNFFSFRPDRCWYPWSWSYQPRIQVMLGGLDMLNIIREQSMKEFQPGFPIPGLEVHKAIKRPQELETPGHSNRTVGLKADIWSLAAAIYTFVLVSFAEDCVPAGLTLGPRKNRLIRTMAGRFETLNHGYAEKFRQLLLRCLAFDPDDRPSARELLSEIQEVINLRINHPNNPLLEPSMARKAYTGVAPVTVAHIVPGIPYHNPGKPIPGMSPMPVDDLNTHGATQAQIDANHRGGKKHTWIPLRTGPDDPAESVRTMQEINTREVDARYPPAVPVVVPLFLPQDRWKYYATHYDFRDINNI